MGQSEIEISVVAPFFNEEGNVDRFVKQVSATLQGILQYTHFELVLVDDGSSDTTWLKIKQAAQQFAQVTGIKLSRNFGHQGALLAGLNHARGEAVITMDGDLQHPPTAIPDMITRWRNGADLVLSRRIDHQSVSPFKKASSRYFYSLFSSIAEARIESGSSDFRLISRKPLEHLLQLRYGEPFLRGAVNTLGFNVATIEYHAAARFSGRSKYGLGKMLSFARQGLISHSATPLRLGIYLGVFTGLLSILELLYVVTQVFRGETVPGWASILAVISLLFSVLFFILGVVGLYLVDIHRLLKQTPHFITSEVVGREPK